MPRRKIPRLSLSRPQILAYRRYACALDQRLPAGPESLRRAAWAGLQDSMPRAALLSIHARVQGAHPACWEDPPLVQIWGPRFSAYVVADRDLAIFTLGRLPQGARQRDRALTTADRLHTFLDGRRMGFGQAGHAMKVAPNSLRYAAPTGRVLMRWDGARQPVVWTIPAPDMEAAAVRLELARRFLHIFGPATAPSFRRWAGIGQTEARSAFEALGASLTPVNTPIGEGWILTAGEEAFRTQPGPPAPARLLPSGDTYFLLWGADREILVTDAKRRAQLWTSRVWPGAVLLNGEIAGTWRRAGGEVSIEPWRKLSKAERESVEAEALSLPLGEPMSVRWT